MSDAGAQAVRARAPFGARDLEVVDNQTVGAYRVLFARDRDGPPPAAGQFYMLSSVLRWGAGEGERPFLGRAFSVMRAEAGPPEAGLTLQFLLEQVGPGTDRLGELAPGEGLRVTGPLGVGFSPPSEGRRPLLCGGGVGVAPLAIWQDALAALSGDDARTLLGFRDADHAELAAVFADPRVATDDGSVAHHGRVSDLLAAELDADTQTTVYACGPPPMLEAVRAMCAARGVPAQLALEAGMACGYGACFGCVVPTRAGYVRVCVDGPVLDAALLDTALGPGHASPRPAS